MSPRNRSVPTRSHEATTTMAEAGARRLPLLGLILLGLTAATSLSLLIVVALRVLKYPDGAAPDFRIFLAAGRALLQGVNPYHPTTLGEIVNPHPAGGEAPAALRFPYLLWFGYALSTIARLPAGWAVLLWEAGSILAVATSGWLLARELRIPHPVWATIAVTTSGVAVADYALGETDAVLFVLVCCTVVAGMRGRAMTAATTATAAALLKPQVVLLLPICVVLAFASGSRQQRRAAIGILATVAVLAGLPTLAQPRMTQSWLRLLLSFSASVSQSQVGLGGLDGLARFLPSSAAQLAATPLFTGAVAAAGVALCAVTISHLRHTLWFEGPEQPIARAWILAFPLTIWLLTTPYSHLNDLLVAYPLCLLVVGSAPADWNRPAVWSACLIILLGPSAFALLTGSVFHFKSLEGVWLLPMVLLGAAQVRRMGHGGAPANHARARLARP